MRYHIGRKQVYIFLTFVCVSFYRACANTLIALVLQFGTRHKLQHIACWMFERRPTDMAPIMEPLDRRFKMRSRYDAYAGISFIAMP